MADKNDRVLLRTVPIHRSLNRPQLILGCDRECTLFAGLVSATMVFYILEWKSAVAGVLLWFVSMYVLRRMAKADPYLRHVYIRNKTYQSHYAPRPTPFRVTKEAAQKRRMRDPWKR